MSPSAIILGIFAIAKAVPVVDKWLEQLTEMYITRGLNESREYLNTYENKRKVILKQIQKAETDEERLTLSIILNDHNNRV